MKKKQKAGKLIPVEVEENSKGTVDLATDFVAEELFDRKKKNTPLISLSPQFYERPLPEQIKYLLKLASSYHASAIDLHRSFAKANDMLFAKEDLIKRLQSSQSSDRAMMQKQLIRMNQEKQDLLQENQALQARVSELEKELAASG